MACDTCKPLVPWIKQTGVSRNILSYLLTNNFNFPNGFKDCLEEYYILHYTGTAFMSRIYQGLIERNQKEYVVVYKNCTPASVRKATTVKVSYRTPLPIFNLPAYALVQIL